MTDHAFYARAGERYIPLPSAIGPWHPDHQNGAAFCGLLAHLLEDQGREDQQIARLSCTILGPGLMRPVTTDRHVVRAGRKMAIVTAELRQDRPYARATALYVRRQDSPAYGVRPALPAIDGRETLPAMTKVAIRDVVETRLVHGGPEVPGPGATWARMRGRLIEGVPPSPLVQAAIIADFGSGLAAQAPKTIWSFANLDLDINFLRPPRPGWHYVDARATSMGQGTALAMSDLYDEQGLYAMARQTLFIERRSGPQN
ncbi:MULTISPECIES: thioesterase family protein [unclassified Sphingobium]|uniref:thioesterase family protein n=1 Tax=unclassified Sphingobium TaxID=2611147 RepID=UPI000D16F265|nr:MULTISPECIES: thioesterase family protein [unclassified Sphingobium]MBG6120107.1 acyl-coenzyme A thioesterase PaaI-like protein [Sphingobium sp. JAI105]PSO12849.1 hypothetical protein C7E20_03580 [Sphingobium sp. AEW4]TWD05692.1 acyl-CoA thioesterase [Sphingobium sp. AEW010]TWD23245.1 acyl-CoA thioesterase [Sphingobium sp. AEW013]TWD25105.1 acyl-CoA thioesterase [Sphingobium sp. AEW001]